MVRQQLRMEHRHEVLQNQMRVGDAQLIIVVAPVGIHIEIVIPHRAVCRRSKISEASILRQQVLQREHAKLVDYPQIRLKRVGIDRLKTQQGAVFGSGFTQRDDATSVLNECANIGLCAGDQPTFCPCGKAIPQHNRAIFDGNLLGKSACLSIGGGDAIVGGLGLRLGIEE